MFINMLWITDGIVPTLTLSSKDDSIKVHDIDNSNKKTISQRASFDDTEENWEYKDCAMAESKSEKIHIYVYYNEKIKKYRCELRYTKPGEGNECSLSSKNFGMNAISTADISKSDYDNGSWKKYDYWFGRNM